MATPKRKDLTEREIKKLLDATRKGRHSARDYAMLLLAFRHGLRVSELVNMKLSQVDLETGRTWIQRLKGSVSNYQPLAGDEIRALRAWLRARSLHACAGTDYLFLSERGPLTRQAFNYILNEAAKRANFPFPVHPHMLRHSTGFYLANKNTNQRIIQDYLGHKNGRHTEVYTRIAEAKFKGLFD
jgi:integrase